MPPRCRKKTYKSVPAVDTDTDTNNNNKDTNNGSSNTSPAPSPSASAGHSDQIRPPESTPISGGAPPPSLNNILDPTLFEGELGADLGLIFDFEGNEVNLNQLFSGLSGH